VAWGPGGRVESWDCGMLELEKGASKGQEEPQSPGEGVDVSGEKIEFAVSLLSVLQEDDRRVKYTRHRSLKSLKEEMERKKTVENRIKDGISMCKELHKDNRRRQFLRPVS